jgi:hypothetical protein
MLRSAPPETYDLVFASNDPRSRELAFQLRAALTKSGWTNASTLEIPDPESKIGIFAPQQSRGVGMLTNWARRVGLEPEAHMVPSLTHPRLVVGRQQ